ncbi:MAG: hypothetical protein QY326_05600 [Bdellovibrionota bacterium]|nr:MAG: hypothetical protein QY326_05600 [Bdellovibrionota bacterium]
MEVKDVSRVAVNPAKASQSGAATLQRNASVLISADSKKVEAKALAAEPAPVKVEPAAKRSPKKESLDAVNKIISAVNVADEATAEIDKLLKSVDGIVRQAAEKEPTPQRLEALEREAKQLVDEIRKTASNAVSDGVRPLLGEEVEVQIETLDKALDLILPEGAKDGFGLNEIALTRKEAILNTRVAVAVAREQLEGIRSSVDKTKSAVAEALSALEIAAQNTEAANNSLRDVDKAAELVGDATLNIKSDPKKALQSFQGLQERSLDLLK